ncbi:hypothetical protein EDD16DRAFT_1524722 [Pisolithus croceorrhizus]|nr:hypothetical protein EDD16DRAFT_1524722 [Pisolithus croceorrhizus]
MAYYFLGEKSLRRSAALWILYAVSQLFLNRASLDKAMFNLLDTVRNAYDFLAEQDRIPLEESRERTLLGEKTGKNIFSETHAVIGGHVKSLEDLVQQCHDRMARDPHINTYRIFVDLGLDGMAYAVGVGFDKAKECLDMDHSSKLHLPLFANETRNEKNIAAEIAYGGTCRHQRPKAR